MKEHGIQNTIRDDLASECICFRANVGAGWTASKPDTFKADRSMVVPVNRGDVVLRNARRFDTGLPEGFHDLFGIVEVEITPDMVGKKFARFFSLEVKSATGRPSPAQIKFRQAVQSFGGVSDVVRSSADALALIARAKEGHTCH